MEVSIAQKRKEKKRKEKLNQLTCKELVGNEVVHG
jgi:hypothetical protein